MFNIFILKKFFEGFRCETRTSIGDYVCYMHENSQASTLYFIDLSVVVDLQG